MFSSLPHSTMSVRNTKMETMAEKRTDSTEMRGLGLEGAGLKVDVNL